MDKDALKLPNVNHDNFFLSHPNKLDQIIHKYREWRMDPPSHILDRLKDGILKEIIIIDAKAQAEYARVDAKRMEIEVQAKLKQASFFDEIVDTINKSM